MVTAALLLALVVAIGLGFTRAFAAADAPADHAKQRVSTLDGLRGFLALAVLVHHNLNSSEFLVTRHWGSTDPATRWLGEGGVALFFMITAFLFWGRLLRRPGRVDWLGLYVGRLFRIGPLYLVFAGLTLVVTVAVTRHLNVPWSTLAQEVAQWACLGAFRVWSINGSDNILPISLTWTLHYEWMFYAALPVLAVFARTRRTSLPVAVATLLIPLGIVILGDPANPDQFIFCALFGVGMLTASLAEADVIPRGPDWARSALVVALLVLLVETMPGAYAPLPVLLLVPVFYLIATGTTLFGLLTTRVAHRLGHISFGIYLLHGLVVFPLFRIGGPWLIGRPAADLAVQTIGVALTLVLALAAHRWVERPGIGAGDRALAVLRTTLGRKRSGLHASPGTVEHR